MSKNFADAIRKELDEEDYRKYDAIVWYSLLVLIIATLVIVSPIVTIWSLNTLFHTTIEYTIWTYLSALWLTGLIAGSNGIKSR
jgi:hypothetical protein